MVSELPKVNWKVGLKCWHMCMWERSWESRGKWLKLLLTPVVSAVQTEMKPCTTPWEPAQKSPSLVVQWSWACGLRLYGIGKPPQWLWGFLSAARSGKTAQGIYCCLATSQCLPCNSWDCALMRPTDASWNALQMNHHLLWHLCLPFLSTLQTKRQKAFLWTVWTVL